MANNSRGLRQAESPTRVPLGINVDEWSRAIEEVMRPGAGGEGMSSRDIAARMGVPLARVMKALNKLAAEGRLSVDRDQRQAIDGTMRYVPIYTIRPAVEPVEE